MARTSRTRLAAAGGGLLAAGLAGALAVSLSGGPAEPAGAERPPGVTDLGDVRTVALSTFSDCGGLLRHYRDNALEQTGVYGFGGYGGGGIAWASGGVAADAAAQAPTAMRAAGGDDSAEQSGTTSATGTNVQVAGVDEADVAKLDGDRLIAVNQSRGQITVTRLQGTRVTQLGTLRASGWWPQELLVARGNRVLVLGTEDGGKSAADPRSSFLPWYPQPRARIAELEIPESGTPRLVRTLDVDGSVTGARLTGDVARLVLVTTPRQLTWVEPRYGRDGNLSKGEENRVTAANKQLVTEAPLETWVPGYALTRYGADGRPAGTPEEGLLLDCDRVATPPQFAGLSTLSLLGLDLAGDGVAAVDASAVVAEGSTVYATAGSTYVATGAWASTMARTAPGPSGRVVADGGRTAIHQFENAGTSSRYLASGSVPGHLLNQFAMDEHDGVLRVASTTRPEVSAMPMPVDPGIGGSSSSSSSSSGSSEGDQAVAPSPTPSPEVSSSRVTVLRRNGDVLQAAGSVTGLGKTEQIRSVRFLGDVGYVVTFRQTDPLYTLDLSDPAQPRVTGELKIPGYSAYLHPAGEGRLLGLGQDAGDDGRVTGLQASLFDVSDPAQPKRLAAEGIRGAFAAQGEENHHAFTYAGGLLLAPFESWSDPTASGGSTYDAGVLAVRVGASTLAPAVTLRPQADGPLRMRPDGSMPDASQKIMGEGRPLRTFVTGDAIYTLTDAGVAVHDARTLRRVGFTAR